MVYDWRGCLQCGTYDGGVRPVGGVNRLEIGDGRMRPLEGTSATPSAEERFALFILVEVRKLRPVVWLVSLTIKTPLLYFISAEIESPRRYHNGGLGINRHEAQAIFDRMPSSAFPHLYYFRSNCSRVQSSSYWVLKGVRRLM